MPVVADEAQFAKLVHEMADSGSSGADHLRQRFLTDVRIYRLWAALLSEIREQQQHARKSPLLELMIDQVLLNPAVAGQEIRNKHFGKCRFVMKGGDHRGFRD